MLQGFQRMERGEVYKVLTREQQAEVRKRILARRAAAQKAQQERNTQPTPTPHAPTQQPARPVESSKPPQPPLARSANDKALLLRTLDKKVAARSAQRTPATG